MKKKKSKLIYPDVKPFVMRDLLQWRTFAFLFILGCVVYTLVYINDRPDLYQYQPDHVINLTGELLYQRCQTNLFGKEYDCYLGPVPPAYYIYKRYDQIRGYLTMLMLFWLLCTGWRYRREIKGFTDEFNKLETDAK